MLKIYVDGDSNPYITEIATIANQYELECIVVHDSCRIFNDVPNSCKLIEVEASSQAVDNKIYVITQPGDLLITSDHGLASICLGKGVTVLDIKGNVHCDLFQGVYFAKRQNKKAKKLNDLDRKQFIKNLCNTLDTKLPEMQKFAGLVSKFKPL